MNQTTRVGLSVLLGIGVAAFSSLAYSIHTVPDESIVIMSLNVFKTKKKTPVLFSHNKHKTQKCTSCHHEFERGNKSRDEGLEVKHCGACHKLENMGRMVSLDRAFHRQCVECHKKAKKSKAKGGPTRCSECHPKRIPDLFVNKIKARADAGNAYDQYRLGLLYREGLGVKRDYRKAAEWFLKAAERGNEGAKKALEEGGVEQ